ncbi:PBECR4 domain-containing protein [Streptococcus anginosus]|uniref:PBECR4 domain-containing protein n=1 Tax=Streptococcus anginosus TaxID=1328 RepID=UPI00221FB640|nr:PBECR4 domain-containing protein [Streptococcus anginosus]MCW1033415.1 PBECR4 domain-containing protein [Streptococcus anginosus]
MTEQESRRGKSRRERVEFARSRDILDVANELQMELVRSGRDYRWKEHDSLVISPDKNLWKWFSRNTGGDAISLVETIKEVDFNQSVDFLNDGNFKEFQMVARAQEDFKYYLEKYEQQFSAGRDYLRNQRGLSDETIDYFLKQGVLAQANAKLDYFAEGDSGVTTNAIEPVIVFKSLSSSGEVVGASLQGIQENWEKWPKHGYAKVIMKNSDPMTGIHVDIGSPKRLIFTESPIDLMSYYELHKDSLQDVRLVSMDGLKESTIGRHLSQIQAEISGKPLRWTPEQMADGLQVAIDHHFFEDGKNADLITLALDNDKAGRTFIQELEAKGAVINSDLPELRPEQDKTDWNDVLKNQQEEKSDSRESEFEEKAEATLSESSPFPDTSHLSPEDATWLKENWNNISFSVQSTRSSETDLTMEDKHIPSNQESIANTEKNAERLMSYEEVKQENEALTKRLNNRIQSGELSIEFAPDFYLYDVFAKLGNSHPTKYLNDKRMEVLSPIHSLLSSIDDRTVDLYKKKGTPEQDSLYQALKPHQRALGVDISTQFIGELAIAAYNTNKQLESLSSDSFGAYFGERTLDNLSQSVERMLEYPLIESGTRDFAHGFVTTPNTLFHYLDEQEGEVVLNHELLDNLMSRLETHPIKIMETSEEKAPEKSQELDVILEQQKNERTSGSLGSLQPEAEGSPTPVPKVGTFERSVTSRPTTSSHLLYFTINEEFQSSNDGYYHSISLDELTKLNRPIRRLALQNAAQYYLDELANSKIYYVTPDKTVQVHFEEKHFMHLTGIKPIASGQTPEKTLHDFAEGNGHFDNILLANNDAAFDKLKVLSDLSVATESTSFYFDDLTNLRRYDGRFDSLIKSDDKDIILLFKELEEENYIPISVFKSRTKLTKELETVDKTPILGVFRERDGQIEQLSINEEYVKDGGEEMLSILKNKQYEEVSEEPEPPALENTLNNSLLDANKFTQVLDTVYNLGVPSDISKTPEEFHQAWNQYLDYAKQYNDKFDQIVAAAGEDNLLDKNSDFYRDWHQDHIYKDDYHIRLQWSEDRPGGPKLPFKETELISYQDFARELYKANQDFYPIHQEGMKQVTAGNTEGYIPPTKIKFDVYAPGGEMIKEGIRYDIGAETTPISQMLGLGYRRLNGQSVLASMDEEILSQLENREVNKEISQEANESTRLTEEVAGQTPDTRETVAFKSSKQETKTNLLQRVEEILKEEPISDLETHEVNSSSIDYATLTPHELSEVAFKKVREYTETPERLEEYLNFMSKFPELSPRNVALIQEQWPGASAVATYNQWQSMGEVLGITSDQVFETRNTYTNKKQVEQEKLSITICRLRQEKNHILPCLDL